MYIERSYKLKKQSANKNFQYRGKKDTKCGGNSSLKEVIVPLLMMDTALDGHRIECYRLLLRTDQLQRHRGSLENCFSSCQLSHEQKLETQYDCANKMAILKTY